MPIELLTPSTLKIIGHEDKGELLDKFLTFTDKTVTYQIQKFKKNRWFVNKFGEEAFTERINELKELESVCLLNEKMETYSGLLKEIQDKLKDPILIRKWEYPEFKPLIWYNKPDFDLRYYQIEAVDALKSVKHGAISLPTGSGKSAIIRQLIKDIGLNTVVMAPSTSIALQLFKEFKHHFGIKMVGLFGDGKKEFKKKITVAISKSLVNLTEDMEAWDYLSKAKVFIADESHLCPADTLKKVCLGVLGASPYRFFVSATQMRNDGSDLLLKAIIGPLVYEKTGKELIDSGFLAKPNFLIKKMDSESSFASEDALKMLSYHHYNNRKMHQDAAELANKLVSLTKHQVLIMIDHIEQFQYLYAHLKHRFELAHGGVNKDNKRLLPEKYWKSDPTKLVDEFNEGKLPILIGTGCISMGTDIKPVNSIINLQAGKSEVKFLQLVGRGTRCTPTKNEFNFIEYDIMSVPMLHNHSKSRIKIYKDFYDNVRYI